MANENRVYSSRENPFKWLAAEEHAGARDAILLARFQEIIKFTIWGFTFLSRLRLATHIYSQVSRQKD